MFVCLLFIEEFKFSHCIAYSCVRTVDGGGMSSSSFAISVIDDVNEVHGILIVLRFASCLLGDWLFTETVSF